MAPPVQYNSILEDQFHGKPNYRRVDAVAGASSFVSVLNLVNNIVGAGLFSMPWVLQQASILVGCLLLGMMAILNGISFILLAKCCDLTGSFSYFEMGKIAFGQGFGVLVQFCVGFYSLGSCISYVVLIGDFLVNADETGALNHWAKDTIFAEHGAYSRALVLSLVALVVFMPLALLRSLEPLKFASFFSLLATLYAAFLCIYTKQTTEDGHNPAEISNSSCTQSERDDVLKFGLPVTIFAAIPIVNVSYTAHYNGPRYYQELKNRSIPRFTTVVTAAMIISAAAYTSTAVAGYLTFGACTADNVLLNLGENFNLAVVARLALSILVAVTFPMAHNSLRASVVNLHWKGEYTPDNLPTKYHVLLTVILTTVATLTGILVEKVTVVLAYKGAIFGSFIVYILPALMYVRLRSLRDAGLIDRSEPGSAALTEAAPLVGGASVNYDTGGDWMGGRGRRADGSGAIGTEVATGCWNGAVGPLMTCRNIGLGSMFVWGVVTMLLGTVISALKQAHYFDPKNQTNVSASGSYYYNDPDQFGPD